MSFSSKFLSIPAVATISLSIFLSSCATPGQVGTIGYDHNELRIINQGRAVGAVAGAAAGYAIARNNSSSDGSRVAGALAGGLLGGLAGDAIGKKQADNAQQKRLDNESMAQLLANVRAENQKLVDYNKRMARRIAEIRKAEASERAKLAKAELASANKGIQDTDKMISERDQEFGKLTSSQRSELARENSKLKSQRQVLVSHRDELSKLASQ